MASETTNELLASARSASKEARARGQQARAAAVRAMRALEERVQRAVAGDCLRGLAQLAPGFFGANVRSEGPRGIDTWLQEFRDTLVISKDGQLLVAWRDKGGHVEWRAADDDDLRAEDLPLVVRAAARALARHAERAVRTRAAHERTLALAGALERALQAA